MDIKIEHLSNTFNYGSCMMGINLISQLICSLGEKVNIYIDANSDTDLNRIKKEVNYSKIFKDENIYEIHGNNKFEKLNNYNRVIEKNIAKFDAIIIIGGDDISEYYGKQSLLLELYKINKYSKKIPIFLLGQTIGPFTGVRKHISSFVLKKANIYTRDDSCLEYLKKELKIKEAINGRDLAFLSLPLNTKETGILSKYGLQRDKYITVVPSGLWKLYTNNRNDYIKSQLNIIINLLENKKLINKRIVLLPHVLMPKSVDDRIIIKEIYERLDSRYKKRIIRIDDSMLASEAREILGNGIFTITGRMHAAVSTFYMRKPSISLSYSVKYEGVIGKGLGLNELVIEAADDELWSNDLLVDIVKEKVDYVLKNYDLLLNKIDDSVNNTSEIVEKQLESLFTQLIKLKQK